jgi:hypothetical protein
VWFVDRQEIDLEAYDDSVKVKTVKKIEKSPKVNKKRELLILKARESFETCKVEVGKMEDKVRELVRNE